MQLSLKALEMVKNNRRNRWKPRKIQLTGLRRKKYVKERGERTVRKGKKMNESERESKKKRKKTQKEEREKESKKILMKKKRWRRKWN